MTPNVRVDRAAQTEEPLKAPRHLRKELIAAPVQRRVGLRVCATTQRDFPPLPGNDVSGAMPRRPRPGQPHPLVRPTIST